MLAQPTQSTDLALEDLLGELDDDPTRTAGGRTRAENGGGNVSPSPDSFQVLPRNTPTGNENPRGLAETQMIHDRELLSIMEDISENPVRSSERSALVASESRMRVGTVEAVGSKTSGVRVAMPVGLEVSRTGPR